MLLPITTLNSGEAHAKNSIRVFHIGNSLTYGVLKNPRAATILGSRGCKYEYGWHILWGSTLGTIWDKAGEPSKTAEPYGAFKEALGKYSWDALTLQPYGSILEGDGGDAAVCKRFIELAVQKSPDIQVFIYETWPGREKNDTPDFSAKWTRHYQKDLPGVMTGNKKYNGIYSGEYCKKLVKQLNRELPKLKNPVCLIPVGSVMHELNRLMKDGMISGYGRIEQLYADLQHLNPVGNYVALCTFYGILMKDDPRGLPGAVLDKSITDSLAGIIQEQAWETVSSMELTGMDSKDPWERSVGAH